MKRDANYWRRRMGLPEEGNVGAGSTAPAQGPAPKAAGGGNVGIGSSGGNVGAAKGNVGVGSTS